MKKVLALVLIMMLALSVAAFAEKENRAVSSIMAARVRDKIFFIMF